MKILYQESGAKLKEILKLDLDPVAIKWSVRAPKNIQKEEVKSRFCTKLDKAAKGEIFYSTVEEEECMGGIRYSGMKDRKELPTNMQSGAFLVPAGVYKSIPAVQRSWKNNMAIESGIFSAVIFSPISKADFEPDIIFLVCNSKQAYDDTSRQCL